ncbi:uncharacterized protein LOC126656605 isoform X2 [Mercurialis annua]|uniref:uncharacterized protein LOC126656605 isoform X2 n=1 Tax=Mercurialis annua TaxID=3986 RepID=UPI0021608B2E|nr:uncharacterized protein LOC126656605 isoform X2 [Mercurialis annua]
MVWNYPEISLEELMNLVKGFVDIMILASGYQSSGRLAHWDPHNIKKLFQWASFFEHVLGQMRSSDIYQDSIKELDAAIHEMASSPSFPQGFADLSIHTLERARNFVVGHLFHTLPLRDSHLRAFLIAIVEMDLEHISSSEHDCIKVYLDKLAMNNSEFNSLVERKGLVKNSAVELEDIEARQTATCTDNDLTKLTIQEMVRRRSAASCIRTVGTGLDILSSAVRSSSCADLDNNLSKEELKNERGQASVGGKDQLADFITWNNWKSVNLSYFIHKRTVKLVSGASLIFSGPKLSWVQVFEQLNASEKCKEVDDLCETTELMLLGCIASKWNRIIEYFMSVSYHSFSISKLYQEVCNLLSGRSESFHLKEESLDSKEKGILDYLAGFLDGQLHKLWKLSPVLVAVAIPLWSPLFVMYLNEIETQLKGDSSELRFVYMLQLYPRKEEARGLKCIQYTSHVLTHKIR